MNFDRHFASLKYFTYRLVPVLAPNYAVSSTFCGQRKFKKHYSLAELYVKSVDLNLFRSKGGATFIKHFKGGASYKSLGTSGVFDEKAS
jgi:hypothetical protein